MSAAEAVLKISMTSAETALVDGQRMTRIQPFEAAWWLESHVYLILNGPTMSTEGQVKAGAINILDECNGPRC